LELLCSPVDDPEVDIGEAEQPVSVFDLSDTDGLSWESF